MSNVPAPPAQSIDDLDLSEAAVVVVDMQNDFCHSDGAAGLNGRDMSDYYQIVPAIQQAIDAAHGARLPVVFIKTSHDETSNTPVWMARRKGRTHPTCVKGTWGAEYFGVHPEGDDVEVVKHRYSGFLYTDLEQRLRAMGRTTLLYTGVGTNVCVESTLRDGYQREFYSVLLSDATAAASRELVRGTLENVSKHFGWVCRTDEIVARLGNLGTPAESPGTA